MKSIMEGFPSMERERVVVTGAKGMLGRAVAKCFRHHFETVAMSRDELDICDSQGVSRVFQGVRPSIVVNCAAYTDVDRAEEDVDQAYRVNSMGPLILARLSKEMGSRLVHVSTDYVFDGEAHGPYLEFAQRAPRSIYGKSKALGEMFVEESGCDYLIVRTAWLFGPGGRNFVRTIYGLTKEQKTLKVVDDQTGAPTYTHDLAQALLELCKSGARGLFHFTNSGPVTWYGIARYIVEASGARTEVIPVTTEEFPRPAPRPRYSVLDTTKYQLVTGRVPRPWKQAVEEYVADLSGEWSSQ